MRLLQINGNGQLSIVEYGGTEIPPYAILSHRWGLDNDEVTYKDIMENTGHSKLGYQKLWSCGKQAATESIEYFWVDTCCIDKSSSSELSEAINSMWGWYCNAQVCYAYLNDVSASANALHQVSVLASSKWFTRGWTLQELLAPPKMSLFNESWEVIGTRQELADQISNITGIDKFYLRGDVLSLRRASIAEKMSWASSRETKRPEDIAYSLLGIFDINMPLLYGEGIKAFQRLQEEIIKRSDDQSIFASGTLGASARKTPTLLLAQSPADFRDCGDIVRSINPVATKPYAITNRGLQIEFPLLTRGTKLFARLNCRFSDDFFSDLAIPVRLVHNDNQYQRAEGGVQAIPIGKWVDSKLHSMYISMTPIDFRSRGDVNDGSLFVRSLPGDAVISEVFPSQPWSAETRVLESGKNHEFLQGTDNNKLIVITSSTTRFVFMTFPRKNRFFRDWALNARLLPITAKESIRSSDIAAKFFHWKSKDLESLPRVQKSQTGSVILRATPQLVRGRRLTTIDIAINTHYNHSTFETVERIQAFLESTGHCTAHILDWIYKWKREIGARPLIGEFASLLPLGGYIYWELWSRQLLEDPYLNAILLVMLGLAISYVPTLYRKLEERMPAEERFVQVDNVEIVKWQDSRGLDLTLGVLSSILLSSFSLYTIFRYCFRLEFMTALYTGILIPLISSIIIMLHLRTVPIFERED